MIKNTSFIDENRGKRGDHEDYLEMIRKIQVLELKNKATRDDHGDYLEILKNISIGKSLTQIDFKNNTIEI